MSMPVPPSSHVLELSENFLIPRKVTTAWIPPPAGGTLPHGCDRAEQISAGSQGSSCYHNRLRGTCVSRLNKTKAKKTKAKKGKKKKHRPPVICKTHATRNQPLLLTARNRAFIVGEDTQNMATLSRTIAAGVCYAVPCQSACVSLARQSTTQLMPRVCFRIHPRLVLR